MRKVALFFTITMMVLVISFSGCLSTSGTHSNPIASITTQEPTETTSRANTATLSVRLIVPDGHKLNSLRLATLSAPYASATLLVDGKINQRKQATVSDGNVTLTFSGVPDSGSAQLYLELIGCNISGVQNFSGSATLTSGNNVITLSPYVTPGSNKTSDGKLLVEVGTDDRGRIAFNDSGEPIGFSKNGDIINHTTKHVYGNIYDMKAINPAVGFADIAWLNNKIYLCEQENLTALDATTGQFTVYGDVNTAQLTVDGATLENAKFAGLGDIETHGDTIYCSSGNFTQLLKLKDGVFSVTNYSSTFDGVAVMDNGDVFGFFHWVNGIANAVNVTDGSFGAMYNLGADDAPTSMISYGNGYLLAGGKAVYYHDGTTATKWLTPESLGDSNAVAFYIYKNQSGAIYVCSEVANKIWRVE